MADQAQTVASVLAGLVGADAVPARHNVFRPEGEYWFVVYEGDVFRLRDSKGLRYLATLLAHPGREMLALDLVGAGHSDAGDAGEILDSQARRAYRERLDELREELDQAESWADTGRAARTRQEMDLLVGELARGEGLAGRARRAASASERARQAITKALKAAVKRIDHHSPALGRHLASTVRTGTYCRYDPDPRIPIVWKRSDRRRRTCGPRVLRSRSPACGTSPSSPSSNGPGSTQC